MRLAQVAVGLAIAAAGAGIVFLLQFAGIIPTRVKMFQVTGDPPITIGDGSLHVHSIKNGWLPDQNSNNGNKTPQVIYPAPSNGSLYNRGCEYNGQHMQGKDSSGNTNDASAIFWSDDHEPWDISPATNGGTTTAIITQDDGSGQRATITITAPASGQLSITPQYGTEFDKDKKAAPYNREHNYQGEVVSIVIMGSKHDTNWTPVNPRHPHYTLGFCYY